MLLDLLPTESKQHLKERKQGGSIRWLCKDCHTLIAHHRHLISVVRVTEQRSEGLRRGVGMHLGLGLGGRRGRGWL